MFFPFTVRINKVPAERIIRNRTNDFPMLSATTVVFCVCTLANWSVKGSVSMNSTSVSLLIQQWYPMESTFFITSSGIPPFTGNFHKRWVESFSTRTVEMNFLSGVKVGEYSLSGVVQKAVIAFVARSYL